MTIWGKTVSLLISLTIIVLSILFASTFLSQSFSVAALPINITTIKLSQVYFKQDIPTYLPVIGKAMGCDTVFIRKTLSQYNIYYQIVPSRSSYNIHGHQDYYTKRGNPYFNPTDLNGVSIRDSIS